MFSAMGDAPKAHRHVLAYLPNEPNIGLETGRPERTPAIDSASGRAGECSPIQHDHFVEQRLGSVYGHLQAQVLRIEPIRPRNLLQQILDHIST
jgi:hypothetical protein